jgi:hypothetical protein
MALQDESQKVLRNLTSTQVATIVYYPGSFPLEYILVCLIQKSLRIHKILSRCKQFSTMCLSFKILWLVERSNSRFLLCVPQRTVYVIQLIETKAENNRLKAKQYPAIQRNLTKNTIDSETRSKTLTVTMQQLIAWCVTRLTESREKGLLTPSSWLDWH